MRTMVGDVQAGTAGSMEVRQQALNHVAEFFHGIGLEDQFVDTDFGSAQAQFIGDVPGHQGHRQGHP